MNTDTFVKGEEQGELEMALAMSQSQQSNPASMDMMQVWWDTSFISERTRIDICNIFKTVWYKPHVNVIYFLNGTDPFTCIDNGSFFVKSATHGSEYLRSSPNFTKTWPYQETRKGVVSNCSSPT